MSDLDSTALYPAPEGYVVDFDNPQRRADVATYWCFGIGVALSIVFTAQRVYVKLGLGTGWTLDDWFLLVSWITSMVTQGCVVYGFANKLIGVHVWEISINNFNYFLLDLYIASPIYILAGSCTKIALLIFYLRISPLRWMRLGVFATMAFIIGYSIGIFFSLIFACNPVQLSFDVTIRTGTCISSTALYIATAVCNIASDVMLFCLPISMVLGLQLRTKQKLGLLFIFGIGSITVITSIARAWILPEMLTSADSPWAVAYASMLIVVEANLIIICGMLPTLRKFFRHVAPKLMGDTSYGANTSGTAGKRWSKPSHPRSAGLVTFGSLPPSSVTGTKGGDGLGQGHHHGLHGHRTGGYAKFGREVDFDGYALDTVAANGSGGRGGGGGGGSNSPASIHEIETGRVDTHVVAGDFPEQQTLGRMRSLNRGHRHRNRSPGSAGSEESQLPIMGATQGHGMIKATTRIEVSYDKRDPDEMI